MSEKIKKLTCIICPRGCELSVKLAEDGGITDVSGNFCKRGSVYANDECTNPVRTVTSTVKCSAGVVSVKTSKPIPKGLMFDVMNEINKAQVDGSVTVGDVIIENVLGLEIDIIATSCK